VFALASGDVGEARHPQRHSETWGGQLDGAEEWSIRDGSDVDPPLASPFRRITATRLRGFPDAAHPADRIIRQMLAVTTSGDLPGDHEVRGHETPLDAWSDYHGRILELEIHGYAQPSEEAVQYGRRWACNLLRGPERLTVTIERTG